MSGHYTANVDGSFHSKSGTGGWGFLIKDEDGVIIHSDSGAVPSEFQTEYEQYAFAQMMTYAVTNKKITNLHVKTDLMIMARRFSAITLKEIFEYIQKFQTGVQFKAINFSIEHIQRKLNKEADTLSKSHIYKLFTQEKKEMLETCYPYGHKDLNFLQMPQMKFSIRSTSHDVMSRVLHALKRKHLFVKVDVANNHFETYYHHSNGEKRPMHSGKMMGRGQNINHFFLGIHSSINSRFRLVFVTEDESTYNDMIGFTEGALSPSNSENFVSLIENVEEVYVYHEKPKQKQAPKKSKSLKTEIQNMSVQDAVATLKKNNSKRIRQMIISVYLQDFHNTYGRVPKEEEIKAIIASVDSDNAPQETFQPAIMLQA